MKRFIFFLLITLSFYTKATANENDLIPEMRDNWHQFLTIALRQYPEYDTVKTYPIHSNIQVYEGANVKRVILWITGNAFLFDEPESHSSFLRYVAETTNSKIFALSHRKIPEYSYDDIKSDIIDCLEYLKDSNQIGEFPIVLIGDSSGAFLATQLLPEFLKRFTIEQLNLIAPAFDMASFLSKPFISNPSLPLHAQQEMRNQAQMMQMIANLLYKDSEKIESCADILFGIESSLPKIHVIAFEYDVFYSQALFLKSIFNNITIDCREAGMHCDYLLKKLDENVKDQPFILSWD